MIEIICKDDSEKTAQEREDGNVFLPKNIRQVGSPRGRHRIYLEDYVYTYLRNEAKNHEKCAAVFLGKSQVVKDIRYTFVSGVVECSAAVFQWENICLDDSFWDYIYKEQKQFFAEMEIVGWALGKAGQAMELTPAVEAAHRKYFAGRDKILMLLDILEGEELFFVYEQGYLQKREGYYIFYEKNLAMQSYMIYKKEEEMRLAELKYSEMEDDDTEESIREEGIGEEINGEETVEGDIEEEPTKVFISRETDSGKEEQAISGAEDGQAQENVIRTQEWQDAKPMAKEPKTQAEEALESYRKMLLERQGRREERRNRRFLYTASSFFLVVLCVIGITTINNYRKMQEVESVLNIMRHDKKQVATSEDSNVLEQDTASGDESLVVKTVESQIEPLQETQTPEGADAEKPVENAGSADGTQTKDTANAPQTEKQEDAADNANVGKQEDSGDNANVGKQEDAADNANVGKQEDSGDHAGDADNREEDNAPQQSEGNTQQTLAIQQEGDKRYYTVQAGDTLNTICLNIYHSKDMVKVLKEVNGIEDGDKILVGQRLLLP